ncbi:MAG: matrixin family metalloprotease, partial [Fibrobacteres bacterium]|nr:matrixin family metalloprotease [Fibrobacterota bacterium]
ESFDEWTTTNGTAITASFEGTVNSKAIAPNHENLLLWEEGNNFHYDKNVIAVCAYWYTGTLPAATLTDFDITFNGRDFEWSSSGEAGKMDVKSIAVHEIGHALGVAHSDINAAVMYPYATIGSTSKRTLFSDDSIAIVKLYPRTTLNNHAPVITSSPITEAIAGMRYSYDVNATDADGDTIKYKLITFPLNMRIDSLTGVITWWPKFLDLGKHNVVVEAKDKFGAFARQTFTVTVGDLVISMRDTSIGYADTLYYPVYITSMDGYGIVAGNVEVGFSSTKMTVLDIDTIGSVIAGTNYAKNISNDTVKFAFAASLPYSGDGILFRMKVLVNKEYCGEPLAMTFKKVLFNDGNPVATAKVGTIYMACGAGGGNCSYNITGQIYYEANRRGVSGVKVRGPFGDSAISNGDGYYELLNQPRTSLPCTLKVAKDSGDVRKGVSAFDASLILRNVVGIVPFNTYARQPKCADVNTNTLITAYDAALILRYIVGLNDITQIGHWIMTPAKTVLPNLLKHTHGINFDAAMIGDVSGNWNDANSEMPKTLTGGTVSSLSYSSLLDTISNSKDSILTEISRISFASKGISGAYSGEFELGFDTSMYKVISVTPSMKLNGFTTAHNIRNGKLCVAFAGTNPISGDELLFDISLAAKPGKLVETDPSLSVTGVRFNETSSSAIKVEGTRGAKTIAYGTLSADPNPFNPKTVLTFNMPRRSEVTITIHDVAGRYVATLLNGVCNGGTQRVIWNGKDSRGNVLGAGIYFASMKTAGGVKTMAKLLLVK